MTAMMRAIVVEQPGGVEQLKLHAWPLPQPGPEEILVQVAAVGINRADILQRQGRYKPPLGSSEILGLEIAGEVVACGAEVSAWQVGDRVFGLVNGGGYADYCCLHQQLAMAIPPSIDFVTAAALPENFFTADECLFSLGRLKTNQTVLIHAAASGVGTAAVQLAVSAGAKVIGSVGNSAKIAAITALGASEVIDYQSEDGVQVLMQQAAHYDVILDVFGGSYLAAHLTALKPAGRLVHYALMQGRQAPIDLTVLLAKNLQLTGFQLRSQTLTAKQAITQHFLQQVLPQVIAGTIKPIIDSVFPFAEVQQAHQYLESRRHIGKLVLQVN